MSERLVPRLIWAWSWSFKISMRSAINATEGTMGFSKRPFLVPECSVMSVIAYEGAGSEGVIGH